MRVTFDFHGFVQQRSDDMINLSRRRRGERYSIPLATVLRGDGIDGDDAIEGLDELLDTQFVAFEALGDRYVCAGCYLCSAAKRRRELIEPAVKAAIRDERLRVRRRRAKKSKK